MRYKVEINLLALKELESEISLEEAVLLDYLYWLCSSPSEDVEKMRIEKDGKKYTWFDYGFYIKETPILKGKTKATITPKIKKLEEEEFIETIMQKDIDYGGNRKYVRLLSKCDNLFRKLNEVVKKTKRDSFRKLNVDNNINNNNNTIDNNIFSEIFNFYLEKSKTKERLTQEKLRSLKTRMKSYSADDLKLAITHAYEDNFYSGNNNRGWKATFYWIMKNDEHVERLINLVPKKGTQQYGQYQNPNRAKPGKYAHIQD